MKRYWAVLFAATMLAGCRSSQPATNPFLRTTVPPPATGEGLMVMPGEPMATPPVVTTPAPPAVSPAVPVTPAPGPQAPLIAPPPASPEQKEFHPPGGSYLYHQSSNDRATPPAESHVKLASAEEPAPSTLKFRAASSSGDVAQTAYREEPARLSTGAAPGRSSLQFQQTAASSRGDPPETMPIAESCSAGASTVRIVGQPTASSGPAPRSTASSSVLRMTLGPADSPQTTIQTDPVAGGASQVAIVNSGTASPEAPTTDQPTSAVTQTAFQPAP